MAHPRAEYFREYMRTYKNRYKWREEHPEEFKLYHDEYNKKLELELIFNLNKNARTKR